MYITGHPLDEYREELSQLDVNTRTLSLLSEESEDKGLSMDGTRAVMGGIVTEVKTKATRKGDMMAFVTLEDFYGSTEALIFPKPTKNTVHSFKRTRWCSCRAGSPCARTKRRASSPTA